MKNLKSVGLIVAIVLALMFFSCKTEVPCKDYEANSGAIISNVDLGKCFVIMNDTTYVVRTRTQLHALQQDINVDYKETYGVLCDTLSMDKLVEIDFSQESILGFYTEANGCSVSFGKKLTFDHRNLKAFFEITVYECGNCEMIRSDMNWVKTEKIPDDYSVEYILVKGSAL